jgi:hypothetical protein
LLTGELRQGIPITISSKILTERIISPPRDQLQQLRTPLTDGELTVFKFFDALLPVAWEIYIQPHLNGLRPDFVLLHPRVGIAVFEVKDWNLSALKYKTRYRENKPPELIAVDAKGKEFSIQDSNPIERINRYKKEIYQLYCPRLRQRTALAVITAGVIFTQAKKPDVEELLLPFYQYWNMERTAKYYPLSGSDELANHALTDVFPEAWRQSSFHMNEVLAKDLRNWLVEPDFAAIQRQPLETDAVQRRYINTRTKSGYRRLKGPAGSGKSVVLAARAAQLISEGKTVLVITYNITLLHYLMDLAVRWPHGNGNTRRDITWLNFHAWCKRVCEETDHDENYRDMWRNYFESEEDTLNAN